MASMILVSAIIAGACLLAASWTDLKTREVPDLISYGMSALGLGIATIFSISQNSWMPLLESAAGFAIGFLIGMAMFYTGQWGGGDSKALMGIGALMGASVWNLDNFSFFTFLINILFVGAAYGMAWSIALAFLRRNKFWPALKKAATTNPILWQRRAMMAFAVAGIAASFLFPDYLQVWVITVTAFVYVMFYVWIFIKTVEQSILIEDVNPAVLTEGDWVSEDVYVKGKYIAGPKDLGVSRAQIAQLISLSKRHKIKTVKMKKGIPLVPSWLLAYLFTMIAGNWILRIVALLG